MMKYSIVRTSNSVVTDFYLDIIAKACEHSASRQTVTITARYRDAVIAKLKGSKVIFWSQGIGPEEFAMRYNNKLKLYLLDRLAKLSLKMSDFVLFVSDAMREHYEQKYHIAFDKEKQYVMPCFNTSIYKESFFADENKYKKNTFVYIGSLEKWQGVDHILECYKRIEEIGLDNTSIEIYTSEQDEAKALVKKYGLNHYSIGYCKNEELPFVLKSAKYGFILRDDNPVNRVSTPTKLSTYLANGVIPIYSECLDSFHRIAKQMRYAVEEKDIKETIRDFDRNEIVADDVYKEYSNVFNGYYSCDYHINKLKEMFNKCFK